MSTFGIVAKFPLGVFVGHRKDGSVDGFPDPARLHAALTHAASTGATAVEVGGRLKATHESVTALRWLEENPPDGIELPHALPTSGGAVSAYRAEGTIVKEGGAPRPSAKVYSRSTSDVIALSGPVGWSWNGDIPEGVRKRIALLCEDVSCLGEATSPVVLEIGQVCPNLLRDPRVRRFSAGGTRVRIPAAGRFDALEEAHYATTKKPLSSAADRWSASSSSDSPKPSVVTQKALTEARYDTPKRVVTSAPWANSIRIDIIDVRAASSGSSPFRQENRVRWAVALHRAFADRIGVDAPPLITGKYTSGMRAPANRIALQYLDAETLELSSVESHSEHGAFLVMIPRDAGADDLLVLDQALSGLRFVRSRFGELAVSVSEVTTRCDEFWRPAPPGTERTWRTFPAVVAETRRVTSSWTLRDATLLSVGHVFRDHFSVTGRGDERYRALREAVAAAGVMVANTKRVHADASSFIHKMSPGIVAQPYWADIEFTPDDAGYALISDQTLLAIGQVRHLGGGLLLPVDVPSAVRELEER